MFRRYQKGIAYGVVALLLVASWLTYSALLGIGNGELRVTFLNVGQGDAVLIETPSYRRVLIDGGRDSSVLRELGAVVPFRERTIDLIVATHPDSDHIKGLAAVLLRFVAPVVVESGVVHESAAVEELKAAQDAVGAINRTARRGEVFDLGDGVYIEILFPDRAVPDVETNLGSVVMRVVYGDTSFLLTGDSPQAIENYLVRMDTDALHSTVLKAGHHGSNTSSSGLFLGAVAPEYVVFSRGCDNSYGHPHRDVVKRVTAIGAHIYDTCSDGRVTFSSDGTRVTVE